MGEDVNCPVPPSSFLGFACSDRVSIAVVERTGLLRCTSPKLAWSADLPAPTRFRSRLLREQAVRKQNPISWVRSAAVMRAKPICTFDPVAVSIASVDPAVSPSVIQLLGYGRPPWTSTVMRCVIPLDLVDVTLMLTWCHSTALAHFAGAPLVSRFVSHTQLNTHVAILRCCGDVFCTSADCGNLPNHGLSGVHVRGLPGPSSSSS